MGWAVAVTVAKVRPWKLPSAVMNLYFSRGELAGELQRRLIGFGAAVAEEALSAEGPLREELGQLGLLRDVEGVVDVQQFGGLAADGLDDLRMAVADAADRPAGEHVEDLVALGVVEVTAFAFDDGTGQTLIVGNNVLAVHFHDFSGIHSRTFQ